MQLEQKPLIAPIFLTLSDSTFFPNVNPVVDQKIPDASMQNKDLTTYYPAMS